MTGGAGYTALDLILACIGCIAGWILAELIRRLVRWIGRRRFPVYPVPTALNLSAGVAVARPQYLERERAPQGQR